MELPSRSNVSRDDLKEKIERHKEFLIDTIDSDFGILDILQSKQALGKREVSQVKTSQDPFERSENLVNIILQRNEPVKFIDALEDADQSHVVNYILGNGERKVEYGNNWPLTEREIKILDANQTSLVDLIDIDGGLLLDLFSKGVLNMRQKETVNSKPTRHEKVEFLLNILRRRSLRHYLLTTNCLSYSNQSHIAEILEKGGVVVQVSAVLNEDQQNLTSVENEIVDRIVQDITDPARLLLVADQLRIIAAKRGNSIVLYILCKTLNELMHLCETMEDGSLKHILETFFNQLLCNTKTSILVLKLSDSAIVMAKQYFDLGSRKSVPSPMQINVYANVQQETPCTSTALLLPSDASMKEKMIVDTDRDRFQRPMKSGQPAYYHHGEERSVQEEIIAKRIYRRRDLTPTQFLELPVEILDIILQKSYLLGVLNKSQSIHQKDADIILALASVNNSWFQRIRRGRFKSCVRRHLKVYYDESKKRAAIIKNNREYLMENIQPTEEFLAMLLSFHCLNEEQVLLINGLELEKDKNDEILGIIRSVDETEYRNFIRCLRQTKQRNVARVVETGGVVLKAVVLNFRSIYEDHEEFEKLIQELNDILINDMDHNQKTTRLISQLKKESISILSSSIEKGKGIVLWIWCRSQDSLEKLHEMYDSNTLLEILRDLVSSFPSGDYFYMDMQLRIDRSYFERNVNDRSIAVSFVAKLEIGNNPVVYGVTKLGNHIHVLCRSHDFSSRWISMFQDDNLFGLQNKMEINEIKDPWDIVSSEKENCLYVSDYEGGGKNCIWKIKESEDGGHLVTKWLTDIKSDETLTLSVSSDGQLLTSVMDGQSCSLLIYGPDAELCRSISLPRDDFSDHYIRHAVETSKGNFLICHNWMEKKKNKEKIEEEEEDKTLKEEEEKVEEEEEEKEEEEEEETAEEEIEKYGINEVRRDGSVIRCFIPKYGNQELNGPVYLCLDSDDRLIMADEGNERVILLDSDLNWNRTLFPTAEDRKKGREITLLWRLYYDKGKKQLIIGGREQVYVYCFNSKETHFSVSAGSKVKGSAIIRASGLEGFKQILA